MKKAKKQLSDAARSNGAALMCQGGICAMLTLAYIVELIKGSRTIPYFIVFLILAQGPVMVSGMVYLKNKESKAIRYLIAISYSVLYAMLVFTANSLLPFVYFIPMAIVFTLYQSVKFSLLFGVGYVLINVVDIIRKAVTVGYAADEIPDLEIRIALVAATLIFVAVTTSINNQINKNKQKEIESEKDKAEKLLSEVMRLSGELSQGIALVDNHMAILGSATEKMGNAMEEVSAGTQEAADSVQNQLVRTEEIQRLIEDVKEVGAHIRNGMETASQEVQNGRDNMNALEEQSAKSGKANERVVELMGELQEKAEQMNAIITVINGVANRTGMLALNASIEAARAGDAGKGFAVVATQVSDLAAQTKDATVTITEMIETVGEELGQVMEAVNVLQENTKEQNEKAIELDKNFKVIAEMTEDIAAKTQDMEDMIVNLATANEDIVQNIQTISAITEEVTAHSSETMDSCRENVRIVSEVGEIATQLNQNAQELKAVQEA